MQNCHSPTKPNSFKRLMALEMLDVDTYRSVAAAWAPGGGNRAFGGHVVSWVYSPLLCFQKKKKKNDDMSFYFHERVVSF